MELSYSVTVYGVLAFVILYIIYASKKWTQTLGKKNPPGPFCLPVIGNLHMIDLKRPSRDFIKLSKKYGTVFRVQMGYQKIVVLCGYETVTSALVDHADDFAERAFVPIFEDVNQGYGVPFSHADNWKTMRRFTLSTLRDFGMGKKTIEDKIIEECGFLIRQLESLKGDPIDLTTHTSVAIGNMIASIVLGHRFDYKHPTLLRIMSLVNENMRLMGSPSVLLYNMFPILRYLPGNHKKVKQNFAELHVFLRETFAAHLKELDRDDQRSFIDAFLVKQQEENDDPNSYFHELNLLSVVITLFTAGTETTASTIRWAIFFMIQNPDIQKRVHEEIDRVIGSSRPCFEHRKHMHYTNAVIQETQRLANIVPLNLPRETTRDIVFKGYYLPKGTYIVPLLESVLYDKTQFERPEVFYPEHFLNSSGKLIKKAAFLPFSAGRRVCVGETLAVMELFLFFTSLMQKFSFQTAPGETNFEVKPSVGFTIPPVSQKVCILSRS
ncbi:cytochrome P450 2K4 [Bombina bombina]|uniref:cytochrome P450 2K4 n=1 Tax=Bombina bombina TaxID=8345 RepID=UPI00235AE3BC|nr:cytochrome P450 2K4 [Bombina bombina]